MKGDLKSSYYVENVDAHAELLSSVERETASVQVGPKFCSSAFLIDISAIASTLIVQLQNSLNNVDWTDEPAVTNLSIGNDVTQTLDAVGTHAFGVPNPRVEASFIRLKCTATGGATTFSVILVGGPLRHINV